MLHPLRPLLPNSVLHLLLECGFSTSYTLYEIITNDKNKLKNDFVIGPFRDNKDYDILKEEKRKNWMSRELNAALTDLMKEIGSTTSPAKAES